MSALPESCLLGKEVGDACRPYIIAAAASLVSDKERSEFYFALMASIVGNMIATIGRERALVVVETSGKFPSLQAPERN